MYELSVARKYLIPHVRQLSVSCISLISVLVIALVVWLTVVFFSAQESIERKWTEKMVALTAPIRLTPTDAYYQSYYYQSDAYSSRSHFSYKSLSEKLESPFLDPFDPEVDPSLPVGFQKPEGVDIVKETYALLRSLKLAPSIYETAHATITVRMIRNHGIDESRISQVVYVVPFDPNNTLLPQNIQPAEVHSLSEKDILLPKSYKEAGAQVGDPVTLSLQGFGAVSAAPIKISAVVAGFYDPGIIPIGGKVILASRSVVEMLTHATVGEEQLLPMGINVHGVALKNAENQKQQIIAQLKEKGLLPYWNVETYQEFEFTKDIFQQMQSDKNLFSLIALIIIVVASSNIVSMLIILVHDKKKEIAILQALGATKKSIALIFGFCGFCLGAIGALVGTFLAVITVWNLPRLLELFGRLQGFEVLNRNFYGDSFTPEISGFAICFVVLLCAVASTFAGIIASLSACRINTSEALRE